MRFAGRKSSLALPLGAAAVFASLALLGLVLAVLDGPLQVVGYNEKVCLLIGAAFFFLCGASIARVGLKDYYSEILVDEQGVTARGPFAVRQVAWAQVKRVVPLSLGASLSLVDNTELEFGPAIDDFEELTRQLKLHFDSYKERKAP